MFSYMIQPGDTLYMLEARFGVPQAAILAANPGLYPYNLLIGQPIMIPTETGDPAQSPARPAAPRISADDLRLRNMLRRLWHDHVDGTRQAINAIATGSPELQAVSARLARNAADMAEVLRPFYGDANAARFQSLFQDHINTVAQWATAVKDGNAAAAQNAERLAYANADQITQFFAALNPRLPADTLRRMLYAHLALLRAEIVARMSSNFTQAIAIYDQMEDQAEGIADLLAGAIVAQFPTRFQ